MENVDPKLWKIAKRRANFKRTIVLYIIIDLFLWFIWWSNNDFDINQPLIYAWPKWPSLGFCIAILSQGYSAYLNNHDANIQKEYDKLTKK